MSYNPKWDRACSLTRCLINLFPISLDSPLIRRTMFYVYIHLRLDTGEIFYVGKGQKRRAKNTHQRSEGWKSIANKHGRSVHIYSLHVDEGEAFQTEKRLISELNSSGIKLVNLTHGGEGCSGRTLTKEQKNKIGQVHKGKTLSPEHVLSIKRALTGRPSPNKGNKYSDEAKLKISLMNRGEGNPNYGKKHPGINSGSTNAMWGKPSPRRSLTDEQILEIEKLRNERLSDLAIRYGCSKGLIKLIRAHKARPYLWN